VFIIGDLEGTAGVVDFQLQTYNDAKYYEQAKRLATLEVSALIDGILEGGASEVWFLDGHGPGGIDYELMHCESKMVIGRPLVAPWGLDESFDALFLYGHHSMANTERGVLCHSWSSRAIANCWLNGNLIGEIGFNAALAGSFGIPTVFISGDDTAVTEMRGYVPNVFAVETKIGLSQTSAISLTPLKSRQLHQEVGREAVEKVSEIQLFTIVPPYEFVTELLDANSVSLKAKQSDVEQVDTHKFKICSDTLVGIARRR
tara:strand:- start:1045 stop:1821 length:777 start_codon:yes stop_codon:yes gene_type:complete